MYEATCGTVSERSRLAGGERSIKATPAQGGAPEGLSRR